MHRKHVRRIWGNLKKSDSWELNSEREGSTFGARWGQTNLCAMGAARDGGGGGKWKSQHRKTVPLSPYVEKPLNSKVIKSFVPKLRSRKCFSYFGILMFYVYMLWTFYVRFTYQDIWLWYRKRTWLVFALVYYDVIVEHIIHYAAGTPASLMLVDNYNHDMVRRVFDAYQLWLTIRVRHSWCNGYRRWKWTQWLDFKSWIRLLAFHIVQLCI